MEESEHFKLEELSQGVYAAIATEKGGGYSNAGIIDLGGKTLIFDTFDTVQAGEDLCLIAEELISSPITYVIISHWHSDHWCGNQAFPIQTIIISTNRTLELMDDELKDLLEMKQDLSDVEEEIRETQERLNRETDPRACLTLESYISRLYQSMSSIHRFEPRLPDLTFSGTLTFQGTHRSVELHSLEKGHTESDAYLILPDEHIMFMGDLGFFQCQPYMVYSEPSVWKSKLKMFEDSDIEIFIPGHGPIGSKTNITLMNEYIEELENLVSGAINDNKSVSDILQDILPPPFDEWQARSVQRFQRNIEALFERITCT